MLPVISYGISIPSGVTFLLVGCGGSGSGGGLGGGFGFFFFALEMNFSAPFFVLKLSAIFTFLESTTLNRFFGLLMPTASHVSGVSFSVEPQSFTLPKSSSTGIGVG